MCTVWRWRWRSVEQWSVQMVVKVRTAFQPSKLICTRSTHGNTHDSHTLSRNKDSTLRKYNTATDSSIHSIHPVCSTNNILLTWWTFFDDNKRTENKENCFVDTVYITSYTARTLSKSKALVEVRQQADHQPGFSHVLNVFYCLLYTDTWSQVWTEYNGYFLTHRT